MKRVLGAAAVAAMSAALLATLASAQGKGGGEQERVVHVLWTGLEFGVTNGVTIIGPLEAHTTFEIFDMVTVNRSQVAALVQYRLIQPDDPTNCLGPGLVIDEIMRVVVPGLESLHQVFPESLEVPGHWRNSIMAVADPPTAPICVVALVPNLEPNQVGAAAEGRLTLRIHRP
jgi:hypothetical protein